MIEALLPEGRPIVPYKSRASTPMRHAAPQHRRWPDLRRNGGRSSLAPIPAKAGARQPFARPFRGSGTAAAGCGTRSRRCCKRAPSGWDFCPQPRRAWESRCPAAPHPPTTNWRPPRPLRRPAHAMSAGARSTRCCGSWSQGADRWSYCWAVAPGPGSWAGLSAGAERSSERCLISVFLNSTTCRRSRAAGGRHGSTIAVG